MKKNKVHLKKLALSVVFSLGFLAATTSTQASLQDEMDSMFGEMSNTTMPGVFKTQARGVIAGGRFTSKSKIFDENLVSFAPPSFKGGCGGVDMFGGSFSFVSGDQIVQLLRQTAANAKGYAFQLALDNVCKSCATWIETFQKKIQSLNQHLGNSCQLAQGIVNDATSSFELKGKTDASAAETVSGLTKDWFGSWGESGGKGSVENIYDKKGSEELIRLHLMGNIVWQQLQEQGVRSWFQYGDTGLLETMMSLTGTVVRGEPTQDKTHPGTESDVGKTQELYFHPAKVDLLRVLLEGGTAQLYSCASDNRNCLKPSEKNVNITGLGQKVQDMLLGTGSRPGIIHKFAHNYGDLSAEEQAFMVNLPSGTGTIVRNLAILSEDSARIFAIRASDSIALTMVYTLSEELLRAVNLALTKSKAPHLGTAIEFIGQSQQRIRADFAVLQSQHGDPSVLIDYYNGLLLNLRKNQYTLNQMTRPRRSLEN